MKRSEAVGPELDKIREFNAVEDRVEEEARA